MSAVEAAKDAFDLAVDYWADHFTEWMGQHPEVTTAPPAARVVGWSGLIAAGAYLLGVIPTAPKDSPLDDARGWLVVLRGHLLDPVSVRLTPQQVRAIKARIGADLRAAGVLQPQADGLGADVMPSPNAVNQAQGAQLANAVARMAAWQRAHHHDVHGGLVEAQGRADAATAALALASADQAGATVDAVRYVVGVAIPAAVRELTTTVRELRQTQQAANVELRHDLAQTADRLMQRIGDLVRWLRTEALPDIEEQVKVERATRRDADRELHRGIATEVQDRTGADAELLAMVAPLASWFGSFGLHTTEKVRRNESVIDELEHLDWSMLLAFTGFPALTALVARLLPTVASSSPAVLSGLEGAAASLLGGV